MTPRIRLAVIGTGGTIADTPSGRLSVTELLDSVAATYPEEAQPSDIADLGIREVLRAGSETFGPREWVAIAHAVADSVDDAEVDGAVVTHGTFSVEETAFFLHLTVPTSKPIAVTCSQRRHGTIGNDGDANLIDAIKVAASPKSAGAGVVLVVDEEIHSAREVRKVSGRPGGFSSGYLGIIGTVDGDGTRFYHRPCGRHTSSSEYDISAIDQLPRVDVVSADAGADDTAIRAVVKAGAKGLVVNGFANTGVPSQGQMEALKEVSRDGIPVVLVNRGGAGRVPVAAYDGFVGGDNLSAAKARVLLMLALTRQPTLQSLQRIFSEY